MTVEVTSGGGVVTGTEPAREGAMALVGALPSAGVHARHVSPIWHDPPPEQQ